MTGLDVGEQGTPRKNCRKLVSGTLLEELDDPSVAMLWSIDFEKHLGRMSLLGP